MTGRWIEMGEHIARPGEKLIPIEQEGFGIVCAILDYEGESVYRILHAMDTQAALLAALEGILWFAENCFDRGPNMSAAWLKLEDQARAAIAQATGRELDS